MQLSINICQYQNYIVFSYYFLAPAYHTLSVNISHLLDINLKSKIALLDLTKVASSFQVKDQWTIQKFYTTNA